MVKIELVFRGELKRTEGKEKSSKILVHKTPSKLEI
jgi:hypothetical protein